MLKTPEVTTQKPSVEAIMSEIRKLPIKNVPTLNSFLNARGLMLNMPDLKQGLDYIREGKWDELNTLLARYRTTEREVSYEGQDIELQVVINDVAEKTDANMPKKKKGAKRHNTVDV